MGRPPRRTLLALTTAICLLFACGMFPSSVAMAGATGALATPYPTPELARLDKINALYELVTQLYAGRVDADRLVDEALRGFVAGLGDPYSMYLTKDELQSLNSQIEGSFGGIGVGIEWINNIPTVSQVYPDTPAAQAGLKLGDQFVSVGGTSTKGMTTGDLVRRLRGEPGTTVMVRVQHSDGTMRDYALVRALIDISPLSYEIMDDGIAYVRLTTFSDGATADFQRALMDMEGKATIKGLVLDLRDNGGGLLSEAYGIASMLVPKGRLVKIVGADGGVQDLVSFMPRPLPFPYVVLVNGNSASASEVVAGAVKDHGFGHLIGQRTFGKGSVQSVLTFADGDGIRLTTAHFLTPLGHQIDGVGIEPDIYIEPAGTFPGGRVEGRLGQRDLFPGMVGLDVLELQQDLTLARFYAGSLDGVFTAGLKQALLDFRCKYGVIDPNRLTGAMQSFVAERTRQVSSTVLAPEVDAALSFLRQAIANAN